MRKVLSILAVFSLLTIFSCSVQESFADLNSQAVVNGYGEGTKVKAFFGELEAYGTAPQYYVNFNGAIEIENVAYSKEVTVHWAYVEYDGTPTSQWYDTPAAYCKNLGNNKELWRWSKDGISVPFRGSVMIRYAIKYKVNGVEYWDNNNGADYRVGVSYFWTVDRMTMGKSEVAELSAQMYHVNATEPYTLFNGMVYTSQNIQGGQVNLVYSTDNWQTVKVQPLTSNSYNPNEWSYYVQFPGEVNEVVYVFSFDHDGYTSWDDNFDEDHHMLIP